MTLFPSGYPNATELDADDSLLVSVDGTVRAVPGSVAKDFMLPDGVVDVADFAALAEQVIVDCETVTGWTATLTTTITRVTTSFSQGAASIGWFANHTDGTANGKCYYTFATPVAVGAHTMLGIDLSFNTTGGIGNRPDFFVLKVADGPALTGNVNTAIIPTGVPGGTWRTIILSLEGLTSIKSVGMERLDVTGYSTSPTANGTNRMDNIRFLAESPIDQALASAPSVGVIVGGTYVDAPTQVTPQFEDDKHVLDFRRGSFSGFNRTIWLDSYYIDPTGAVDVTTRFQEICNSAPIGSTVKAPSGALYRFDGRVIFESLEHVTIDLSEATCFITWEIDQDFITVTNCSYLKIIVGQMFGYHDQTQPGNSMSLLAGSPTLVGGSVWELDNQDDAIRTSTDTVRAWPMARTLNQQVGLPGNDGPRWNVKFQIADTTHVAGDVMIYCYDSVTLEVLASTTITATSTPTDYWLSHDPINPRVLPLFAVKKVTATANVISVSSNSRYGRVNYDAAYDSASGINPTAGAYHVTVCGPEGGYGVIEGFGGDAIQLSDDEVRYFEVRNILSSGCRRQGMSFNQGTEVTIEHCIIMGAGRSGIDVEPYTNTWVMRNLIIDDVEISTARNYSFAMANWANVENATLSNIRSMNPGIAHITGGSRGGRYHNLHFFRDDNVHPLAQDNHIIGMDLLVTDVHTDGALWFPLETRNFNSVDYTTANNKATNLNFYGDTNNTGSWRVYARGGAWTISNVNYSTTVEANLGTVNPVFYKSVGMNFDDLTQWDAVDLGETARQFPNTFKGVAHKSVWIPGGFNHLDDPLYRVHSISGTTTRANNLRGIAAPVATGATNVVIAFPSQQPGSLPQGPLIVSAAAAGTLLPATTYYYRIAPRTRWMGPRNWFGQTSCLTGPTATSIIVQVRNAYDPTNGLFLEGWTVLRGTVSGGPYTHRVDVFPTEQIWSHAGEQVGMNDLGATFEHNTMANSSRTGYPVSKPWIAGSYTPVDESGWEPDTNYAVTVTPNWATQVWVTNKTAAGFTANFGSGAPNGATIDWMLIR